jgi:hypothetical protein
MARHGKLPARIVRFLGLVLMLTVLSGCGSVGPWGDTTDFRTFSEATSCVENGPPVPLESRKLYQVLSSQWFVNDPCRGALCSPFSQEQPDSGAYLVNIINEQGVPAWSKLWLIDRLDVIHTNAARRLDLPSQFHRPPPGRTGETCAHLITVPWQKDRDRPFWVADATLLLNPKSLEENSNQAGLILAGLFVLLLVGTLFVRAGYFDSQPSERKGGVALSAGIMIVGCVLLWVVLVEWVAAPIEPLRKIQSFYEFYARMPKANGYLLPFSWEAAGTLFSGPPKIANFSQPIDGFRYIATMTLALWLLVSFKRLYMGLYWVYANLPVEVVFNRAWARGRWPKARELARAIRKGTIGKSAWQSRAMELKARIFKQKLDERASPDYARQAVGCGANS